MLITIPCCDMCKTPLQVKEKSTPFGKYEYVKNYKTRVFDTTQALPHLCEKCALTIDNALLSMKLNVLSNGG